MASNKAHPTALGQGVFFGFAQRRRGAGPTPSCAAGGVGPAPRRQEPLAEPLEPLEHSRRRARAPEPGPSEAVVEDEAPKGEALRHLDHALDERQLLECTEGGGHREGGERALGRDETGLERDEGIATVRLDDEERAARGEDAHGLGGSAPGLGQVVQEVADQHAREGAVAEGEGLRVGRREPCARHGLGSEPHPPDGAVDAEGPAATREPHEVCAFAAADLQAGDSQPGEPRSEQRLLDRREAGIRRRPAAMRGIGRGEVVLHRTPHGGP